MSSVPVCTVVATGVVLSVKVPKVPRPATAAAAPAMASEPMTLRLVLRRVLVLMIRAPCVRCVVGFPATGRTLEGQPQGTRPVTARIPQGLSEEAPERRKPRFPGVLEGLEGGFGHLTARGQVPETAGDQAGRGSVSVKVVPRPSALERPREPPCAVVIALVIDSPRPTPATAERVAVEARKKRVNSLPC